MTIFKQPLLHFLLLGAVIFAAYEWRNSQIIPATNTGIVSADSFIEFIQYRYQGIDKASAQQLINTMPTDEKTILIQRHIKEEVLYREAVALGLNDKDYVIKQRLIQKMEYLLGDTAANEQTLSKVAVAHYFEKNKQQYQQATIITFTHVFIDASRHSNSDALHRANALKVTLQNNKVAFEQASSYGERFVYFTNYVERDANFVASHFGKGFADHVFSMTLATNNNSRQWQGPFASDYGQHLVLVAKRQLGGVPSLSSIYGRVAKDLQQALAAKQLEGNIQTLIDSYAINSSTLDASF